MRAARAARLEDLDDLVRLEEEAFESDRLDRRALRHAIRSPTILALVIEGAGGSLAGYALVQLRRGSRIARLTSLAVAADAGRQGVGRRLMSAAEEGAAASGADVLRLEVRADNHAAIRLYETAAYRSLGTVPDYYEDGEAAARYERALGKAGRPSFRALASRAPE